jgi:LemA protein
VGKKILIGCLGVLGLLLIVALFLGVYLKNNYNQMVQMEENVKEKWSQVENVYQRRFDLIPNLVATVKGYAEHEKDTFKAVTEARAKAGGTFNISDKVLNDPNAFAKFQQAQGALSSALSRLMVVVEKYPELKANQNFLALQSQLEGTENRIAVERKRFNEAAKNYNIFIKQFPRTIIANMFGFKEKPYFKSDEGAKKAPKVEF